MADGRTRALAVAGMLAVTVVALHGYLPGAEPIRRTDPAGGPSAVIAVAILTGLALVVVALGLLSLARRGEVRPAPSVDLPELRLRWPRPTRRVVMLSVLILAAATLLAMLLARLPSLAPAREDPGSGGDDPGPATTPPEPVAPDGNPELVFPLLIAAFLMFSVLAVAGIVVRRREIQPAPVPAGPPDADAGPAAHLARAAELGLAQIGDLEREPRAAIIACYAAMEAGLAAAPGSEPQESDTPTEVLERAVAHGAVHGAGARGLVGLFTEARFSPHVMGETHRDAAIRSLQQVLDELRART